MEWEDLQSNGSLFAAAMEACVDMQGRYNYLELVLD